MSILDPSDTVAGPPTWRCPHCRALQPETSRCRACARSVVTCASCHLFRASIVGEVGYCALDRVRAPLRGDEVRSCWERSAPASEDPSGLFATEAAAPALLRAPVPPTAGVSAAVELPFSGEVERDAVVRGSAAPAGGLMEAPHVAPVRLSETERGRNMDQQD